MFARIHPAQVADVGAAINSCVGIEHFLVVPGPRHADVIAVSHHRRGVQNDDQHVVGIFAAPDKRVHAVIGIVRVHPFETLPVKINLVQRRFIDQQFVQVGDQPMDAAVRIVLKQVPVKTARFAPLVPLRDFVAHEKSSFLPGCAY